MRDFLIINDSVAVQVSKLTAVENKYRI